MELFSTTALNPSVKYVLPDFQSISKFNWPSTVYGRRAEIEIMQLGIK